MQNTRLGNRGADDYATPVTEILTLVLLNQKEEGFQLLKAIREDFTDYQFELTWVGYIAMDRIDELWRGESGTPAFPKRSHYWKIGN